MLRLAVPVLLCALGLLAACAANSGETAPSAADDGPLVASLAVETAADTVRMTLHVTNASEQPVEVVFPSGQSYDFIVSDGSREVWRWSSEMGFTQAVREETWAAGETRTFDAAWTPPAGLSGELIARAVLTSSNRRLESATRFRLP